MLIYILLVAEILLLNDFRIRGYLSKRQMCWMVGVSMIAITGLRGVDVGSDTTIYYLSFLEMADLSFADVLALDKRDFGYFILAWLIQHLTGSFTVITLLTAIAFYVPITLLILRYSDDPGLSYLVLMAFNFFQFSMTGIRQTLAVGMTVLFVLELLKEKPRLWKCLIWFCLGYVFHASAILMVVFPLIRLVWDKVHTVYVLLCLTPITFLLGDVLLSSLSGLFEQLGFDLNVYGGSGGGITTFLVYAILLIWGVFFTYVGKFREAGKLPLPWLVLFGFAVLLQPLVLQNSVLFRVVWYFSIYMIIYIPKLIRTSMFIPQSKKLANVAVYAGVLFMYLFLTIDSAYVVPYTFHFGGI